MLIRQLLGQPNGFTVCHFTVNGDACNITMLLSVFGVSCLELTCLCRWLMAAVLLRSHHYHLVDIVDEVLANSEYGNTVGRRSGMAVDDSTLFENTTLPAIDMDISSDPDILNVWKKSYSLEDITSAVDDTDSDSYDTVSNNVLANVAINSALSLDAVCVVTYFRFHIKSAFMLLLPLSSVICLCLTLNKFFKNSHPILGVDTGESSILYKFVLDFRRIAVFQNDIDIKVIAG